MFRTNTPDGSFSDLRQRIVALWRYKLGLLFGLTVLFTVPYIYLAHHPFFPPRDLPLTWLDRVAGFDPRWVWVYQSVYLLTACLPWLARSRQELSRFVIGFALLAGASFLVFIFVPVRIPRPPVNGASGMYWLLLLYDGPYNAMPSLHVGFLYYVLAFARRVHGPAPWPVTLLLLGWFGMIGWSTLALKEHYAVDLLVGVGLAWLCDLAAWSRMFRISGKTSHSG